ncbi:MAG: cytochrome c [Actinobacteria bacterium]|nr:cytochrome c [Actinomycetota bacterium]
MPADLVTGGDADAVASYVAAVAGKPVKGGAAAGKGEGAGGGAGASTDGKGIFGSAGCGGCHTLADAGSQGNVGPNLDEAKPSVELAVERVTKGKGVMPSFADELSEAQIQAVAEYVSKAASR